MFTKKRPKTHQKQTLISTEEAYRLWAKTSLRYTMINHINLVSNYCHDVDLKLVLKRMNELFQRQASILEEKMNQYSIKSPQQNRRDIKSIGNAEVQHDKHAARIVYSFMQLAVTKCFLSIRDSVFNDSIRELFYSITREDVNLFEDYIEFILLKGWLEEPPLYKSLKNAEKRVATNEIWHLWELLHSRYISKQQTKYFSSFVIDQDFSLLLKIGLEILDDQINQLEGLLLYYGVNLPDRLPKNIPTPESKARYDDSYIFKILFMGMKNAATIHGIAVAELVINKEIRTLFKNFLFQEMDLFDKIIKYGKVKGWITMNSQYRIS